MKASDFSQPGCWHCPHYQEIGSYLNQTRYCRGFSNKKKARRFRAADPQCKAPKWCPRRVSPPICRVYGFTDTFSEAMEWERRNAFNPKKRDYIYPSSHHYKLRLELPIHMTAKQFFVATRHERLEQLLPDLHLEYGEIIEIGDGLKPYFFYYYNYSTIIPVGGFEPTDTKGDETHA